MFATPQVGWLVSCFEDLRRFSEFQSYRDLEAGYNQPLSNLSTNLSKHRDRK